MKFKLSDKTSRFAKRTLADFSEKMIAMLADMPLEEMSVQKMYGFSACFYEKANRADNKQMPRNKGFSGEGRYYGRLLCCHT